MDGTAGEAAAVGSGLNADARCAASDATVGDVEDLEAAVCREIRRLREAAGLTQSVLAKNAGFARQHLSRAENPVNGLPSENVVAVLDTVLGAGGSLVRLWVRAAGTRQDRRRDLAATGRSRRVAVDRTAPPGPPTGDASAVGVQGQPGPNNDSLVLGVLDPIDALDLVDSLTGSVIARYEIEGPALLAPEVHAARVLCRGIAGRVGKDLRRRVAAASARQAALLSYMSVNLHRHADAQVFASEGFMLAAAADDHDLMAWIKGTQSFAAYYQGRYRDALRHAHSGLRLADATDGAQRARLLSNGVARAAAKLGEVDLVGRSINQALDTAADSGSTCNELSPCIAFDQYSSPRILANAATAYLSVGHYNDVLDTTGQLNAVVQESDSDWSRALVGLDAATAHARRRNADLDHAAQLGLRALHDSRTNPIASIGTRAADLADELARRGGPRGRAEEFTAALVEWRTATGLSS